MLRLLQQSFEADFIIPNFPGKETESENFRNLLKVSGILILVLVLCHCNNLENNFFIFNITMLTGHRSEANDCYNFYVCFNLLVQVSSECGWDCGCL